ncbi:hypothetical protein FLA4_09210 [Candidatus Rickettsia kotlanii]|nr:hypothetical protein FLA4_09210 [Candidatus Rickettsia kotlanii]BDU61754.1 hypothetical protein HM2_09220 [Candidatus Rickettsia kotlanii]
MQGLVEDNGKWRKGNAAIFKGTEIIHFAPTASRVSLINAGFI